jgi:hypothetical protein
MLLIRVPLLSGTAAVALCMFATASQDWVGVDSGTATSQQGLWGFSQQGPRQAGSPTSTQWSAVCSDAEAFAQARTGRASCAEVHGAQAAAIIACVLGAFAWGLAVALYAEGSEKLAVLRRPHRVAGGLFLTSAASAAIGVFLMQAQAGFLPGSMASFGSSSGWLIFGAVCAASAGVFLAVMERMGVVFSFLQGWHDSGAMFQAPAGRGVMWAGKGDDAHQRLVIHTEGDEPPVAQTVRREQVQQYITPPPRCAGAASRVPVAQAVAPQQQQPGMPQQSFVVQVPPGSQAGDVMMVTSPVTGQTLQVVVPPGCLPGGVFPVIG